MIDKKNLSALNITSFISHLQKKQYEEAMKETNYGWNRMNTENYKHVGCPDDLFYVFKKDLPHPTECVYDCEECWKYVLKNKWK